MGILGTRVFLGIVVQAFLDIVDLEFLVLVDIQELVVGLVKLELPERLGIVGQVVTVDQVFLDILVSLDIVVFPELQARD